MPSDASCNGQIVTKCLQAVLHYGNESLLMMDELTCQLSSYEENATNCNFILMFVLAYFCANDSVKPAQVHYQDKI